MATIPVAHVTQGPPVVRPLAAPVPVPPRRGINLLIPLCVLGLVLFLIAATIVLSLIPVYLTRRGDRVDSEAVPYTVLYRINNGTLPLGSLTSGNCDVIQRDQRNFAASNNNISTLQPMVVQCVVTGNTTVPRRRRQSGRPEGNLISTNGFLRETKFCRRGKCLTRRAQLFIALLLARGTFFLTFAGANGTQYLFSITIISASISPPVSISSIPLGLVVAGGSPIGGGSPGTGNPAPTNPGLSNDIAILNYALTTEYLEANFYARFQNTFTRADFVAAGFTNETYAYFSLIATHEDTHARVLSLVISQLGGTPVTPCTYNFSSVVDVRSYVAVARVLENTGAMAYSGAANGISDPVLREMAATVATVEARHAAYLNQLNGVVPFPSPFENAMEPAAIIQAIQPFIVSCPFTITAPIVPYIGSSSFTGTPPTTNDTSTSPYTEAMYRNDLRALNFALITEQIESTFYNTFAENFTQEQYAAAGFPNVTVRMYFILIREYENAHATFVRNNIIQRGGTPVSYCTYQFTVTNVLQFIQLSRLFENTGARAYDGAIDTISDPDLIRGAATIATVEARFASFLNQLVGYVPFPDAFEPALQPAEVVTALSPYQTCPFTPDLPVVLNPSTIGTPGTGNPAPTNPALINDIAVLNFALITEQLEADFYARFQNVFIRTDFIAAGFTDETYAYFALIATHEDTHARVLSLVISQLGGTPVTPCTYNFSSVIDVRSYVAVARVLENTGAMAYTGAANGISDPVLREMAATIATVEARHAAYLNQLNGVVPFPSAFENATEPAAIVQAIQPFIASCPFTINIPTVPYIGSSSFNGTPPTTNDTSVSPYTEAMYRNDLRALNFALLTEQIESTFYNTFAENFTQAQYDEAGFPNVTVRMYFILIREYENTHATFIRNTIIQGGGTPVSYCTYQFNVTNVSEFVQLSRLFENTCARAYDGVIDTVSDPDLIRGAATIAAVEARFASFLNGLLGDISFPNTFEQALQPADVIALLSPYQTCPFTPDLPVVLNR